MMKMFVGMIIGAVMTIYAAGGAEIADLIMQNALAIAKGPADSSHSVMLGLGIWSMAFGSMMWVKKRNRRPSASQYAWLLR